MAGEAEGAQPKKKSNRMAVFITLILVILLCASIVVGGVYYVNRKGAAPAQVPTGEPVAHSEPTKAEEPEGEKAKFYTLSLGSFVVNLSPPDDATFLSAEMSVSFSSAGEEKATAFQEEIKSHTSQLRHHINMILSAKRRKDISSIDGKERLNREILKAIGPLLKEGQIEEVYFDKFVFQGQ